MWPAGVGGAGAKKRGLAPAGGGGGGGGTEGGGGSGGAWWVAVGSTAREGGEGGGDAAGGGLEDEDEAHVVLGAEAGVVAQLVGEAQGRGGFAAGGVPFHAAARDVVAQLVADALEARAAGGEVGQDGGVEEP